MGTPLPGELFRSGKDGKGGARMTLGAVILEARQRVGWTQTELAQRVGVDPSTIAKLEKDIRLPKLDLTHALAKVLVLDGERLERMVDGARQKRRQQRVNTRTNARPASVPRDVAARGAEAVAPSRPNSAEEIGREILDDPDLK